MKHQGLISTSLNSTLCRKCKGWILEAYVNGFLTKVESNPLNLEDELAARLQGRRIFQTFGTVEPILIHRSLKEIKSEKQEAKVLPSHECSRPTYFEPEPLFPKMTKTESEGIPF